MKKVVYIVGIGPGNKDYIYPAAMNIIEKSDVLIGGKRNLELFEDFKKESIVIENNLKEIVEYINNNYNKKSITVLASGDPGIFSIGKYLEKTLIGIEIVMLPGISSFQYLVAKKNIAWEDIVFVSLHGRKYGDLFYSVTNNKTVAVYIGGTSTASEVCTELIGLGFNDLTITVGENLSYDDERIISGSLSELQKINFETLSVMIIENRDTQKSNMPNNSEGINNVNDLNNSDMNTIWEYSTTGIPDDLFIRDKVPMTKSEVRAVSLSKLKLKENSIICDIGAGSGSVSIECAIIAKKGFVYAIERNNEAVDLIHKNCNKFNVKNIEIIEGQAPDALENLPHIDRFFIGGSGKKMDSILDLICKNNRNFRIVINAVTIQSAYNGIEGLKSRGFTDIDITSLGVARGRKVGGLDLMEALNPVYIISGKWSE